MSTRLLLSFFLLAASASASASDQAQQVSVHPQAPEFSLLGTDGQSVTLSQYKGKVVVLDFWKTSCLACDRETSNVEALQTKYHVTNVVVIQMIVGQPSGNQALNASHTKIGPVILADKKTLDRYGSPIAPASFLIGRDGRIYSKHSDYVTQPTLDAELRQLVAVRGDGAPAHFVPSGNAEAINLPNENELNVNIPGIDISSLTATQIKILESRLDSQKCPCGCGGTMLSCRRSHMECEMSRSAAQTEVQKLLSQNK